ncbi:hypothetical protein MHM83_02390 [Tenacibaculum sp. Mcav3-52]|uniref:hypothetical protein n=1 Tax=Tenacibaculum sp. Mcav3-52 TaxID=2917762 RepID=UPI001EF35665|nr:hypothetical protein [Tenacibaculum sp. Mcav3-52]MCG7500710.1 hypothetical protein [Tenacibaculum sp. Mcav3-52]
MLKNISNLGTVLDKTEQKHIQGGGCGSGWTYIPALDLCLIDDDYYGGTDNPKTGGGGGNTGGD